VDTEGEGKMNSRDGITGRITEVGISGGSRDSGQGTIMDKAITRATKVKTEMTGKYIRILTDTQATVNMSEFSQTPRQQ
jgi:hypothetical protein